MRSSSRRTTKLIGGALFAAAIAATSVATVSTVSADIGDVWPAGYIRVKPDAAPNTQYETQTAPVIEAGTIAGAAGSVQIMIGTDWESGDKITLQVQSDAAGFGPGRRTRPWIDWARVAAWSFVGLAFAGVSGGIVVMQLL